MSADLEVLCWVCWDSQVYQAYTRQVFGSTNHLTLTGVCSAHRMDIFPVGWAQKPAFKSSEQGWSILICVSWLLVLLVTCRRCQSTAEHSPPISVATPQKLSVFRLSHPCLSCRDLYIVSPSSRRPSPVSSTFSQLPFCTSFCPSVVMHSAYVPCPSPFLFADVFLNVSWLALKKIRSIALKTWTMARAIPKGRDHSMCKWLVTML